MAVLDDILAELRTLNGTMGQMLQQATQGGKGGAAGTGGTGGAGSGAGATSDEMRDAGRVASPFANGLMGAAGIPTTPGGALAAAGAAAFNSITGEMFAGLNGAAAGVRGSPLDEGEYGTQEAKERTTGRARDVYSATHYMGVKTPGAELTEAEMDRAYAQGDRVGVDVQRDAIRETINDYRDLARAGVQVPQDLIQKDWEVRRDQAQRGANFEQDTIKFLDTLRKQEHVTGTELPRSSGTEHLQKTLGDPGTTEGSVRGG